MEEEGVSTIKMNYSEPKLAPIVDLVKKTQLNLVISAEKDEVPTEEYTTLAKGLRALEEKAYAEARKCEVRVKEVWANFESLNIRRKEFDAGKSTR